MTALAFRSFPSAATAALLVLLAACGGGGPDTGDAGKDFISQVNLEADGKAKLVSFGETSRKYESEGDMEGCTVNFEGEIEFTDRCYYHMNERKAGERMKFDANIEFFKDQEGWRQVMAGINPR